MYETAADLAALQKLLDESYAAAGPTLKEVITPDRRLNAEQLVDRLQGVCILGLGTVTSDGRPIVAPVDGLFYRGDFWFGSAPNSLRFTHIRRDPHVSASYVPFEELGVTVHGTAEIVDVADSAHAGFADYCVSIYGESWREWGDDALYARIKPARMFTFFLDREGT